MDMKDIIAKLLNKGQSVPKNPFTKDKVKRKKPKDGSWENKAQKLFSMLSVLLSLVVLYGLYDVFQSWGLVAVVGAFLAIFLVWLENKKVESLKEAFKGLSKQSLSDSDVVDDSYEKPLYIGLLCVVASIAFALFGIFMYMEKDAKSAGLSVEKRQEAVADSITKYYAKPLDSLKELSKADKVRQFVKENDIRLYERVSSLEQAIASENDAYNKTPRYKRDQVAHSKAIDTYQTNLDKYLDKIDQAERQRLAVIEQELVSIRKSMASDVSDAKEAITKNLPNQSDRNMLNNFLFLVTVLVEGFIVVFCYVISHRRAKHEHEVEEFEKFIMEMDEFVKLKSLLSAIEGIYSVASEGRTIPPTKKRSISKSNGFDKDELNTVLKRVGVLPEGNGRKIQLSESEAKERTIDTYAAYIEAKVTQ